MRAYIFEPFIKYLIRNEIFTILFLLVRINLKERKLDGSDSIFHSSPNGKKTILALDSPRYRGDLDVLSKYFRVLHITQKAPGWLIKEFYNEFDIVKFINASNMSAEKRQYIAASNFMTRFLKKFYSIISVDCVTTVNFRYTEDHHWVKSSEEVGIPHIMLYREGLLTYYRAEYNLFFRAKRFGKFIGSHIIVHNEKCKNIFLKSEFVSKNDISIAGALRMDKLVARVNNVQSENNIKKNKQVTLFYFHPNMPTFGINAKGVIPNGYLSKKPEKDLSYAFKAWSGRYDLFYDVHETIIKLAHKHKDINFIVKPKDVMVNSSQWKYYDRVVEKSEIDISSLKNYSIEPYSNVHDLIFSSDIVCAMNSSTALESAFIGKPVILPAFKEYRDSKNFEDFHWKDDLNLFDVADNKDDFERLILQRLNDGTMSSRIIKARKELFYKYFDQPKEGAMHRYVATINSIINR